MKKSRFAKWFGAIFLIAAAGLSQASAQTGAKDEALRVVASRSVGMPETTFEVSSAGAVLTVLRINSTMNASTHQGRNNESAAIAKAIAEEFARKAERYSVIQSITVDYVERTGTPAHDRLGDRIDFRKNTIGKFELHIS
jgi:hypothetical protein